jgi:prevent-host-death family protein
MSDALPNHIHRVASAVFNREIGAYFDRAQKEAVVVTVHDRPRVVVLSVDEYLRLKARDRDAMDGTELDAAWAAELGKPLPADGECKNGDRKNNE